MGSKCRIVIRANYARVQRRADRNTMVGKLTTLSGGNGSNYPRCINLSGRIRVGSVAVDRFASR